MPIMNGLDAVEIIRKIKPIPVIFATGNRSKENLTEKLIAYVNANQENTALLYKPFDIVKELIPELNRLKEHTLKYEKQC